MIVLENPLLEDTIEDDNDSDNSVEEMEVFTLKFHRYFMNPILDFYYWFRGYINGVLITFDTFNPLSTSLLFTNILSFNIVVGVGSGMMGSISPLA